MGQFGRNILAGLCFAFLASCSQDLLKEHAREKSFYTVLVNAKSSPQKANMASEKIFYSDNYPMRFALYSDNRFYYEVDELGDGWGKWIIEDGVMKLYAARPFFDMRFVLSGAEATGDVRLLKFRDETGLKSIRVSLRDPEASQDHGATLPPLRKFKKSNSGI